MPCGRSAARARPSAAPVRRAGARTAWRFSSGRGRVPSCAGPCHSEAMEDRVSQALLDWYDGHARVLPWRVKPGGAAPDPYRVWLSEVMLQQTTTAAVVPYFARFTERWPTVDALAAAAAEGVMVESAGRGRHEAG